VEAIDEDRRSELSKLGSTAADTPTSLHPTRVLVVDDHHLFRTGLRRLLGEYGLRVVGDAPDGKAALALAVRRSPEVIVLDLHMPGMSGIEVARRLADKAPSVRVLILTVSAADGDVVDAIEAGAVGYLLKDALPAEIVRAIRAAAEGHSVLSPSVAAQIVRRARRGECQTTAEALKDGLSERELEVLRLLAEGKGNNQIAAELFISPATVKDHVSAILSKLEVSNRVQAAIAAVKSGLA
jgi:DNA-binding NarL/FixJ family response regulator